MYLGTDEKQQSNAWTSVKCLCNSHLITHKPYNYVSKYKNQIISITRRNY